MRLVGTSESSADPIGELVSTEQSLGLEHLAFTVNPLGLDGVEPRALGGQEARYDSYPTASVLGFPVMGGDPASDLSALMPACVVPDKKQSLLAPRLEPLAAVPEELRGVMELTGRPSTNLSHVFSSSGTYSP